MREREEGTHEESRDALPTRATLPKPLVTEQTVKDGQVQQDEQEHRQQETVLQEEWM